jgi:hypothetical protein
LAFLFVYVYIITMGLMNFWDWLAVQEDSAFGRSRRAAALGLGPSIPDAEINSRNTAPAWQQEKLLGKKKKKKRLKKKVSSKPQPTVHHDLDNWLQSVDSLKKDLERLKGKLFPSTPETDDKKVVTRPIDTKPEKADKDPEEKSVKNPEDFKKNIEKKLKKPFKKDVEDAEE